MRVYVNQHPVELLPGMTVKHAIIQAGLLDEIARGRKPYDGYGNEVGLDGAVFEGMRITVK
jgi:hypothetical protein